MKAVLVLALAGITLVSVPEEIEIGRKANAQMRRELRRFTDAEAVAYVQDLGARLARGSRGPRYPYSFTIADYREINAFALPGGPIWINRGVLQTAATEAQVAGVLAHEIAHVQQRHAADQLTRGALANWSLGFLGALLGNSGGANTARMAAGVFANGAFLKFSRDHERDADRAGLRLLTTAGWDGRGMVELFEVLRREQQRDPMAVEVFFSSHPPPADRITALQAELRQTRGGRRDTARFQRLRTRLSRLPAAPRMPRE